MLTRNPYNGLLQDYDPNEEEALPAPVDTSTSAPGTPVDVTLPGYGTGAGGHGGVTGRGSFEVPRGGVPGVGSGRPPLGRFFGPEVDYGDFNAPAPFTYKDYQGPTAETFQTDPGYGFRKTEGERTIKNNASAEHMLRSGGTLKALMDYNQGLATQEFGNVDARAFRNWNAGRDTAKTAYDSLVEGALQEYNSRVGRSRDTFDRSFKSFGANAAQDNVVMQMLMSLYGMMQPPAPNF